MRINDLKDQLSNIEIEIEADRRELQQCLEELNKLGVCSPMKMKELKEELINDIESLTQQGADLEEEIESRLDRILNKAEESTRPRRRRRNERD